MRGSSSRDSSESLEDPCQRSGIVFIAQGISHPQSIGLTLIVADMLEEQEADAALRYPQRVVDMWRVDRRHDTEPCLSEEALAHLTRAMPSSYVTDLMAEYADELARFVPFENENPSQPLRELSTISLKSSVN